MAFRNQPGRTTQPIKNKPQPTAEERQKLSERAKAIIGGAKPSDVPMPSRSGGGGGGSSETGESLQVSSPETLSTSVLGVDTSSLPSRNTLTDKQRELLKNADTALRQGKISQTTYKSLVTQIAEPNARAVGQTATGGTFNVPKSSTIFASRGEGLAQPTGNETAGDIVRRYREQEIDLRNLPAGSEVRSPSGASPIADLLSSPSPENNFRPVVDTISPSPQALGNQARGVYVEQEKQRIQKEITDRESYFLTSQAKNQGSEFYFKQGNQTRAGPYQEAEYKQAIKEGKTKETYGYFANVKEYAKRSFIDFGQKFTGQNIISQKYAKYQGGATPLDSPIAKRFFPNLSAKNRAFEERNKDLYSQKPDIQNLKDFAITRGTGEAFGFLPRKLQKLTFGAFTSYQAGKTALNPTPKNVGESITYAGVSAGFIGGQRFSAEGRGNKALSFLEKVKESGEFPTTTIRQGSAIKTKNYAFKTTDVIIDKPAGVEIQNPEGLVTSRYKTDLLAPGVASGFGGGKRISQSVVTLPSGEQFSTIRIKNTLFPDKFIRSSTRGGVTETKVFSGDKLLKSFSQKASPDIVFTAPRNVVLAKSKRSIPEFRQDITKKVSTQKGVSNVPLSKKYAAFGEGVSLQTTKITTKTKSPATTSRLQDVADFGLNERYYELQDIGGIKTKYRYVPYRPQEKPFIREKDESGVLFVDKPAESLTRQKSFASRFFQVGYGQRAKNKPSPKKTKLNNVDITLLDLQRIYTKQRNEKVAKLTEQGLQVAIGKEGQLVIKDIQKPAAVKSPFNTKFSVFSPAKSKELTSGLLPINQRLETAQQNRVRTSTIPITEQIGTLALSNKIISVSEQSVKQVSKVKTQTRQAARQEQRTGQRNIQSQSILQNLAQSQAQSTLQQQQTLQVKAVSGFPARQRTQFNFITPPDVPILPPIKRDYFSSSKQNKNISRRSGRGFVYSPSLSAVLGGYRAAIPKGLGVTRGLSPYAQRPVPITRRRKRKRA